ncbi:MAG: DUF1934 domain-containing protein [Eubacteriales bacterium]|nr:DUF1934 domain-containing protein [Eubacteriales bacterium]
MGKSNVLLRISNRQYSESVEKKGNSFGRKLTLDDEMEEVTEATVYEKNGNTYITYEEVEDDDRVGGRVMVKIMGDVVEVHRYNKHREGDSLELHLEEGKSNFIRCILPIGTLNIEMVTHKVEVELDENGHGRVFAEYSMNIGDDDMEDRRVRLELTTRPL